MIDRLFDIARSRPVTKARWTFGEVLHHRLPERRVTERANNPGSTAVDGRPTTPPERLVPGSNNPVLTAADVTDYGRAEGVADPFLFVDGDAWHLFFEVYNSSRTPTAVIGHAVSDTAGRDWTYDRVVLQTETHLSFPYVFESDGDRYMLPDSWAKSSDPEPIRLYRASAFPGRWQPVATLVDASVHLHDCVVFEHDGRWWALAGDDGVLHAYHSEELTASDWEAHPSNPVVEGRPGATRPGGRPFVTGEMLVVYFQDCRSTYGERLRAFEVTDLTTDTYRDRELDSSPALEPTDNRFGWNAGKMHHVDYEAVDGRWRCVVDGNIDAGRTVFGNNWSIGVYETALESGTSTQDGTNRS